MNSAAPPPSIPSDIPSDIPSIAGASTPRTLRAREPAELLAQVHLQMRAAPRDSIALIGHVGRRRTVVTARIDLAQATGHGGPGAVTDLLSALVGAGADGAFGIVVVGDGRERVCHASHCPAHPDDGHGSCEDPQDLMAEPCEAELDGVLAAMRLLALAGTAAPGFDLGELWVLAGSRATAVRAHAMSPGAHLHDGGGAPCPSTGADAIDISVAPPVPLDGADSTLVAAEAVLAGEDAPGADGPGPGPLRAVLILDPPTPSPALPRPRIEETWRAALEALSSYRARRDEPSSAVCMTVCERLCVLSADLRDPLRRDRLTAIFLGRGKGDRTPCSGPPSHLLRDPRSVPHASITPGGQWYEGLALAEAVLRPPGAPHPRTERYVAQDAWCDLAALLALLAWWNHRFATAGSLADDVCRHDPEHSLARWVALMAGAGLPPAWTPRTGL